MAIVQEAFFIPDDVVTGIATGLYRRIGGVVRYATGPNKGQIVKHLNPIDLKSAEEVKGIGTKAFQFVMQHKKEVIITLMGVTAIGTGVWIYNKVKSYEPKVVTEFRAALSMYINVIRNGNVDVDTIDKLKVALENLKKYKNYEKISIQFTLEDLEVLVGRIYEYTIKLAEDNDIELSDEELKTTTGMKNSSAIINLQNYLKMQKRIFEMVA